MTKKIIIKKSTKRSKQAASNLDAASGGIGHLPLHPHRRHHHKHPKHPFPGTSPVPAAPAAPAVQPVVPPAVKPGIFGFIGKPQE